MNKFTLLDIWNQMGPPAKGVVIILLIMSMYALGISVERMVVFRRGRRQSMGYIGLLQPLVATPARMTEAVGLDLQWRQSPVARVIGTGVSEFARGLKKLGLHADPFAHETMVEAVRRSMERTKERELTNLRRGLAFLATVSSSAPFVGLFGTVFGIITAFQNMASGEGSGGLSTVSAGISEALMTTAVGLAVAIISVWFYNFFITKVDDMLVDIDETAGEVLDSMMSAGLTGGLPGPGGTGGSSRTPRC
jgi:biopolymer transport protein ExbB/TolQ